MRLLFVVDPVETLHAPSDTSFALMLCGQSRGHRIDVCQPEDLALVAGMLWVRSRRAVLDEAAAAPIALGVVEDLEVRHYDAVWIRTNPPFDDRYLWLTQMLETVRQHCFVLNDPRGLRDANEKLYACHFPELMPETLVTSDAARIERFVDELGGQAVIKPLDGFGGQSVFALRRGDLNFHAAIETLTHDGKRLAMVQRFMPEVHDGDKRILLLDGEPLGAMLRRPQAHDLRSNLRVGGTALRAAIDEADRRIIERLAARLRQDGLWFVGLDVIGGKLTEVNVTSPTGIRQMSRLLGEPLSERVLAWLEEKVG